MPLDAAVSLDHRAINLEHAALNVGIIPLPMAVLHDHKAAELAKYPGSLVGRHPKLFRMLSAAGMLLGLIAGLGLGMVPDLSANFTHFAICEMTILAVATGIFAMSAVQFTAPAEWQSRFCDVPGRDVPAPFREMAEAIIRQVPECRIEVGELVQNDVVLDPYLVIHHSSSLTPLLIGIWDGGRIVASAARVSDFAEPTI